GKTTGGGGGGWRGGGSAADEVHIGFDREARRRKQPGQRNDVVAVEPEPVGQLEPARDASISVVLAIVIDEAAPPLAAQRRIIAARDQARVLQRDHRLVVVTIESPGLHLALRALTAVQQPMEWMQAMIASRADVAQLRLEFGWRHRLHSAISALEGLAGRPSTCTSTTPIRSWSRVRPSACRWPHRRALRLSPPGIAS